MPSSERYRPLILQPDILRDLFQHLNATDVDELEVVWGNSRLYLRREPGRYAAPRTWSSQQTTASGTPIVAPLTGVFYARPSPDQAPFAALGDIIQVGQVVGLIETMKMFNEVTADVAGEVLSVEVEEGDLVEAGQLLLSIRPLEHGEMG